MGLRDHRGYFLQLLFDVALRREHELEGTLRSTRDLRYLSKTRQIFATVPGSGIKMKQKKLRLQSLQHAGMGPYRCDFAAMDGNSDPRKDAIRLTDFHFDRCIHLCLFLVPVRNGVGDQQFDGLMSAHAALHDVRPRESERPNIRLVGGIRPVSLVFHFKYVSCHEATCCHARRYLMLDRTNLLEGLYRCNEIRKRRVLACAVDVLDDRRLAGDTL